jgi:tRNA dimethylallyltransferase
MMGACVGGTGDDRPSAGRRPVQTAGDLPGYAAMPRSLGPGVTIGLLGPTGVGKTAVAVALATRLGIRVISCDSMQVYRGFPVLTNQPTVEETGMAWHEMVGFLDPRQAYSAGEYAEAARPLIEEDLLEHGWALISGGTGLYLRAALAPLAMAPVVSLIVRHMLEDKAASEGSAWLLAELARRDPAAAQAIGPANTRRLIRALEVVMTTGKPWSGRDDLWDPVYYHPTLLVALTLDRTELNARIDRRAAAIVTGGAVEEVRDYLDGASTQDRAVTLASPPGIESAIGFREIRRLVEGAQGVEETVAQVAAATRRYARRQATWLRKLQGAVIIDVHDRSPYEVADQIFAHALSGEHTKGARRS